MALGFSNRSTLRIGNFRGDTLQSLHVSELGKIAKDYPHKAKDVKDLASALISLKEATLGKDPTVVVNLQNNTSIQNNLLMQIVDTIKTTPRDC